MDKPASSHLDGAQFANALMSGFHRVIGDQEYLNRINVFPVPDGDTGTNMALSLGAALELLHEPEEPQLGRLLTAIADALLDSARGNSGAIIAQFFQGMSDGAGDLTRFTPYTFSKAVSAGSEYAHDALSNPREGTILTAIAAYAEALAHQVGKHGDDGFAAVLNNAMPRLEQALADTTGQLEALRKAGVVDAGARGFVDLVKGMHEYIVEGRLAAKPDMTVIRGATIGEAAAGSADGYQYRYCTECIVTGADIDRRRLREELAKVGDSLVLAGTRRKTKIHIHVNDPAEVFDVGRRYGAVSAEKADDLHRQQHTSHHDQRRRFAVITDSAADIADDDMERLDIHMVPCRIQFGERGYLDKIGITADEFFAELATNPAHPTTSQPAPGDFRRQFQFLASHYADVLSINLTGTASGTLEAARSAAGRTDAPGHVHVVNSRNASLGQGLLVVYAAECAAAGMDISATIDAVGEMIPLTRTFGVLKDIDYAVRGGRIPKWARTVANLLHVTAIIRTTDEGRVALSGFFLGKRHYVRKFARHVARKIAADAAVTIGIGHAACAGEAAEFARLLQSQVPGIRKLSITELGAALGVHGGPGTLVVAIQPYRPPQAAGAD